MRAEGSAEEVERRRRLVLVLLHVGMGAADVARAVRTSRASVIGLVNDHGVHVPISAIVSQTKAMDVSSDMWRAVLQTTGQPRW